MNEIDITGIDHAELLARLYNEARPLGMGFFHADSKLMTIEEARELLKSQTSFDYLKGRPLKIQFKGNTLYGVWLYDRDQGEGHCAEIVMDLQTAPKRAK
jgi:hypothetical protein